MRIPTSCWRHVFTFATVHATDADVTFYDGPGMHTIKATKQVYNSTWIALLKHGFVLVKTWLLIACGTGFYAIIMFSDQLILVFDQIRCRGSFSQGYLGRVKRIWYLSPMRAAKVQASLRIRAVSPEPPLLAHTRSESRGTFRQKARSLPPLNGWACAVKICHDGMLEDTNSLDGAHLFLTLTIRSSVWNDLTLI